MQVNLELKRCQRLIKKDFKSNKLRALYYKSCGFILSRFVSTGVRSPFGDGLLAIAASSSSVA